MTIEAAVNLFKDEMINEIFHSSVDSTVEEELIHSVKEVAELVLRTYAAEHK